MSLTSDILYDTLDRLDTALLAGIIGLDGLSVEMVVYEEDLPHDRYEAEVELSGLASLADNSAYRLGVGRMSDMIVQTDRLTYILSYMMPGYYAVLGVQSNGSLGRARFALQDLVTRLLNEL